MILHDFVLNHYVNTPLTIDTSVSSETFSAAQETAAVDVVTIILTEAVPALKLTASSIPSDIAC